MSLKHLVMTAVAIASVGLATTAQAGKTLDAVKARGQVICGVNTSGPGFSNVTAMRWWDSQRGVLDVYEPAPCQTNGSAAARSGDPQAQQTTPDNCSGHTTVFITNDGGRTWHQVPF